MKGMIIAVEGIDGSGKNTQAQLLKNYFDSIGRRAILLHFPMYNETFFAKEVANYLNGEFGCLEQTHPKLTAILYAGDRFEKRDYIVTELGKGTIIILDRYVPSNIAHQGAKLPESDFPGFITWVEELEYTVFGLPTPEVTVLLDMPPSMSFNLVLNKAEREYTSKKRDLHEENVKYLQEVYSRFEYMSVFPGWIKVRCYESNFPRSIEDISKEIIERIKPVVTL